jgi:uncharacterized protein YceK
MRVVASGLLLLSALVLSGCSAIIVAADVAVSTGVAVVGTAADLTVAGVKAVAGAASGSGKDEEKKKN